MSHKKKQSKKQPVLCPKCFSSNILPIGLAFDCLDCDHKWSLLTKQK